MIPLLRLISSYNARSTTPPESARRGSLAGRVSRTLRAVFRNARARESGPSHAGREPTVAVYRCSQPPSPASVPPLGSAGPAPAEAKVLACSVCGRQDSTLRHVSYPYVLSVVVATYRNAFTGLWCRRHRDLWWVLASMVTATLGWLGMPYGVQSTLSALLTLAQDGDQPVESNVALLKDLAVLKSRNGDSEEAVRCLEAALEFRDDAEIRLRLSEARSRGRSNSRQDGKHPAVRLAAAMLQAAVVGVIIGASDSITEVGLVHVFGEAWPIYCVLFRFALLLTTTLVGSRIIRHLVDRTLVRARCRQVSLAIALGVATSLIAQHGLLVGRAMGSFVVGLLSGWTIESAQDAILTGGAILTRGGLWTLQKAFRSPGAFRIIDVLVVALSGAYFVLTSVLGALRTAAWQQRVAAVREESTDRTGPRAVRGWLGISSVLIATVLLGSLFPQTGTIDYLEAIAHHQRGVEFLEQDEPEEAIRELRQSIRLRPSWSESYHAMGTAYIRLGEPDRAIEGFHEAIDHSPGRVSLHGALAWAYYGSGEVDQAVEVFRDALRLDPTLAEAHDGLGRSYLLQGDLGRSGVQFQIAIRLDPALASAHEGMGWLHCARDEPQQAAMCFREAIRLDPSSAEAHQGLGTVYLDLAELARAIEEFRTAAHIAPQWHAPHESLGYASLEQGDLETARKEFQTALELNPFSAESYRGLGMICWERDSWDEAAALLREAIRLDPACDSARHLLSLIHLGRAEFHQAIEQLTALSQSRPNWGLPHALQALAYYQLDRADLAEPEIREATDLGAGDALTAFALGQACTAMGKFSEGEEHLNRAIELRIDAYSAYLALANVYSAQGQFGRALRICELAQRLRQNPCEAHVARGDILIAMGDLDGALQQLTQALSICSHEWSVHNSLSFVYLHKGRPTEARMKALAAIRLQPYAASAHRSLALAYHAEGRLNLATAEAQEAVRLGPRSDVAHYALGLCYMDRGDAELAVEELETFLSLYWDRAYARDYAAKAREYLARLESRRVAQATSNSREKPGTAIDWTAVGAPRSSAGTGG